MKHAYVARVKNIRNVAGNNMKNYISVLSLGFLLYSMPIAPMNLNNINTAHVGVFKNRDGTYRNYFKPYSTRAEKRFEEKRAAKSTRQAEKTAKRTNRAQKLQSIRDRNYRLAWAGISVAGLAMITRFLYLLQNALQQDSTIST